MIYIGLQGKMDPRKHINTFVLIAPKMFSMKNNLQDITTNSSHFKELQHEHCPQYSSISKRNLKKNHAGIQDSIKAHKIEIFTQKSLVREKCVFIEIIFHLFQILIFQNFLFIKMIGFVFFFFHKSSFNYLTLIDY